MVLDIVIPTMVLVIPVMSLLFPTMSLPDIFIFCKSTNTLSSL